MIALELTLNEALSVMFKQKQENQYILRYVVRLFLHVLELTFNVFNLV